MSDLVVVDDLHKNYHLDGASIPALRGVSLAVPAGRFAAIMGASGSGKTTLMHLIGGLDLPDAGRISIAGLSIAEMSDDQRTLFRRRRLGIVFQSFNLLPTLTALENVMLPMLVDGRPADDVRRRAAELIARVHLDHRTRHRPAALSGGEQQRVAIARALMNRPDLVLADEPTGNLDPTSSKEVWALLRSLCRDLGATVLMVTHEPAAAAHADLVHVLREGRLAGEIDPGGSGDAALVADRYARLAD
jgi:putative ABC transport system ATP-binding protein